MAENASLDHGQPRLAYGVAEVAAQLGVSTGFIRLEISRGRLKAKKYGRRLLIPARSLREYVECGE